MINVETRFKSFMPHQRNLEHRLIKVKNKSFKSGKEFGAFLGLSDLDMELVGQKKKLIEKLKKARNDQEISQAELAKVALILGVSFTFKSAKAG